MTILSQVLSIEARNSLAHLELCSVVRRLIAGCGYVGRRVATLWKEQGDAVLAVTRSSPRAAELSAIGIETFVADVLDRETLGQLPAVDSALFAIGYDRSADYPMMRVQQEGMRNLLACIPRNIPVTMVSSTGVYGSASGDWVDETTECRPTRDGGRACLAAEQVLESESPDRRWVVLRSAGIYGPDRVKLGAQLERKDPWPIATGHWLNLVHVEDLVRVIDWATRDSHASGRFNVSDGSPVQRRDYYRYLVKLHGLPEPEFCDPSTDEPGNRRGRDSKRISNRKLMAALVWEFRYPSYREGLTAIVGRHSSHQDNFTTT